VKIAEVRTAGILAIQFPLICFLSKRLAEVNAMLSSAEKAAEAGAVDSCRRRGVQLLSKSISRLGSAGLKRFSAPARAPELFSTDAHLSPCQPAHMWREGLELVMRPNLTL
jgi:hypothetical protein